MSTPHETTAELQLTQKGGPFKVVQVPKKSPAANQVRIRIKATAINLLDKKQSDFGLFIKQYPIVLGIEGAGVIESIGSDVKDYKPGDEIMAIPVGQAKGEDWGGSFAEYTNMPTDFLVARKPKNLSMEEAASLPVGFISAISVIVNSFAVPLPFLPELKNDGPVPSSVLILGGSSGTGAAAIQLLRIAHPSMHIYATSSPHNFSKVTAVGATKVFSYHSPTLVSEIKAQTPGAQGVDMILDFVAAGASQTDICDVFSPAGLRQYALITTGAGVTVPDDVKYSLNDGMEILTMQGGKSIMPALTKLVEDGTYKLPVEVKVVGHGLDAVPQAVDGMPKVSGAKVVVSL